MNIITVVGNVGKDPELRYTSAGKAVVKFGVADTRGKDDDKQTIWHTIVCFDTQAENVAAQATKGSRVIVTGRLTKSSFTGKDGIKKELVEILADEVGLSIKFRASGESAKPVIQADVFRTLEDEEPF